LEKEMKIIEMLGNGTIDGLILSISSEAQKLNEYLHYKKIIKDGVPIVLFDRNSNQIKCDKVVGNDFDSALNATQHLINMDCKRIALISSIDNLFIGKLRAKGYLHALNKNNIDLNPNLIIKTDSDEDLKAQITNLLDNKSIDGIFALDEKESIYAIKICKEKGFQIPKEIKIIGFADGNLASKILSPSLTTISQRGKEVGQAAAKLLIDRLESDKQFIPYKTIIVQTKMKERESTIVSFQKRKKV
jgi:LacI family transcriptional regulator